MAVPKFFEFFEVFLQVLADGKLHSAREVRSMIAESMQMTETELSEMLPSGRQTTFGNRVMWARTYLNKAGLIETPSRGRYCITEEGRKALSSGESIDLKYLERYESFKEFHRATASVRLDSVADDANDESPMEMLEAAFRQVNATLASELMDEVMKLTPAEFETMVVKLLLLSSGRWIRQSVNPRFRSLLERCKDNRHRKGCLSRRQNFPAERYSMLKISWE